MSEHDRLHGIIEAHYAAGAAGDLPGMVKDFAENITWTEATGGPFAGTYIGVPAIIDGVFARAAGDYEGFGVIVDSLIVDDTRGQIAAVGSYTGTHRTTGKTLDARVVHVWTVAGDSIVRFEQIVDSVAQLSSAS